MNIPRAVSRSARALSGIWRAATTDPGSGAIRARMTTLVSLMVVLSCLLVWFLLNGPVPVALFVSVALLAFSVALFTFDEDGGSAVMTEKRTESLVKVEHFGFGEELIVTVETATPSGVHREYTISRPHLTIRNSVNPRVEVSEWRKEIVRRNSFGWVLGYETREWTEAVIWEPQRRE